MCVAFVCEGGAAEQGVGYCFRSVPAETASWEIDGLQAVEILVKLDVPRDEAEEENESRSGERVGV